MRIQLDTFQWVIVIWFIISVLAGVSWNYGFYLWLRRKGIKMTFIWTGTPEYKEHVYRKWSKARGIEARGPTWVSRILLLNLILAALANWLIVGKYIQEQRRSTVGQRASQFQEH